MRQNGVTEVTFVGYQLSLTFVVLCIVEHRPEIVGGVAFPDADEVLEGLEDGRDGDGGADWKRRGSSCGFGQGECFDHTGLLLEVAVAAAACAVDVEEVGVLQSQLYTLHYETRLQS